VANIPAPFTYWREIICMMPMVHIPSITEQRQTGKPNDSSKLEKSDSLLTRVSPAIHYFRSFSEPGHLSIKLLR